MKLIKPNFQILSPINGLEMLRNIERAGRTCYKSEDKITDNSAEKSYLKLLKLGWSPQQARSVLPNSLKTEIVVTANLREWRLIFKQRTAPEAHPQMRELMCPLLDRLKKEIPVIFSDINY